MDIDLNAGGTCALVTQTGGVARLVDLQADRRGQVTAVYANTETETRPSGDSGAAFVANGQGVLHGSSGGCVLVWDTKKGSLVYGLEHEEGEYLHWCYMNVVLTLVPQMISSRQWRYNFLLHLSSLF